MLAKTILVLGLAGFAFANFQIYTTDVEIPTPTNDAQASKLSTEVSELSVEFNSLATSIVNDPKYTSFWSVVDAFAATRTDIPAAVTQSGEVFTYTTAPDWFKALPTDAHDYYESLQEAQYSIFHKVIDESAEAAAAPMAKPTGVTGYMGGMAVAAIAVGAAMI